MAVRFLSRADWGAASLPRLGAAIQRANWTRMILHHTALPRNAQSPSEWDNLAEIAATMRLLQTGRPDLGLDVPYNFVLFCRANGDLVVCEGRGLDRVGAHTAGQNTGGFGVALAGNFELLPEPSFLDAQVRDLADWLWRIRRDVGLSNLGSDRPVNRDLWVHRDFANTLCPGASLVARLDLIRFVEGEEVMDQETWQIVQAGLQALDPPLYAGRPVDGIPGLNTDSAVRAFEVRMGLNPRGVIGTLNDPNAGMWAATRELLFAGVYSPWTSEHEHEVEVNVSTLTPVIDVKVGKVKPN